MKIGVMCSGNGTNFENIVKSCPEIDVVLMVYNKKDCGAVRKANSLGIPSCYIKSKDEDLIIRYFKGLNVDYIFLAVCLLIGILIYCEKPTRQTWTATLQKYPWKRSACLSLLTLLPSAASKKIRIA